MTKEDIIIAFLLILVVVLLIKEFVGDRTERKINKLLKLCRHIDAQDDMIESINGRVESLSQVVTAVVKIILQEQGIEIDNLKQKENE